MSRQADPDWQSRFWAKIEKRGADECWPWKAAISKNGYGSFGIGGKAVTASRLAYTLATGDNAEGFMVLHTCDYRACCNPAHLYKGTVRDNSRDMVERGRWRSGVQTGSQNGAAKLTESNVARIREQIAAGRTNIAIAKDFGVTHQMISKIRRGHFWKHVGTQTVAHAVTSANKTVAA